MKKENVLPLAALSFLVFLVFLMLISSSVMNGFASKESKGSSKSSEGGKASATVTTASSGAKSSTTATSSDGKSGTTAPNTATQAAETTNEKGNSNPASENSAATPSNPASSVVGNGVSNIPGTTTITVKPKTETEPTKTIVTFHQNQINPTTKSATTVELTNITNSCSDGLKLCASSTNNICLSDGCPAGTVLSGNLATTTVPTASASSTTKIIQTSVSTISSNVVQVDATTRIVTYYTTPKGVSNPVTSVVQIYVTESCADGYKLITTNKVNSCVKK